MNKSAKEFMCTKFRGWYSTQVQEQLDNGENQISPVVLKLSTLKPLVARWLVSLYDYIYGNQSTVENGFKAAGLLFQYCSCISHPSPLLSVLFMHIASFTFGFSTVHTYHMIHIVHSLIYN